MSNLYPHVPPMQADAPDWVYLRKLSEIRSPHILVTGVVGHAHAWELAVSLGSAEGAEHHAFMIYQLWQQMEFLTGKIRENEEVSRPNQPEAKQRE